MTFVVTKEFTNRAIAALDGQNWQSSLSDHDRNLIEMAVMWTVGELTEFKPTHRHAKGGIYQVIGRGYDCSNGNPLNPRPVVIYKDMMTDFWVRDAPEFDDGRFRPLEQGEADAIRTQVASLRR